MNCCNTHAGWEADVPVSTLSAPRTQTSSSVLCPSPDASVGSVQEEASARSAPLVTVCLLRGIYIYSHRMQSGGFWLSDWGSRRRWRNARFWFRWRPVRQTFNLKNHDDVQRTASLSRQRRPTLSWEFSMTLILLSEEVTSGGNSTHPAGQILRWDNTSTDARSLHVFHSDQSVTVMMVDAHTYSWEAYSVMLS